MKINTKSPEQFYTSEEKKHRETEKHLTKQINLFSFLRLLAMVFLVVFIVQIFKGKMIFFLFSFLMLTCFAILVRFHINLVNKRKKIRILIQINSHELAALKGDISNFANGKEFLNPEHEFTYDLDIFGDTSVFQALCRCCTLEGEKKLARLMLDSPGKPEEIIAKQRIITELSSHPRFMQDFISSGKLINEKENEFERLFEWLNSREPVFPSISGKIALLLAIVNTSIIISSFFIAGIFNYILLSVLITMMFYGFHTKKINAYHNLIGKKSDVILKYKSLAIALSGMSFNEEFLKKTVESSQKTLISIRKLIQLTDILDTRLNLFAGVVLNVVLLSDIHAIIALEKWKRKNSHLLQDMYERTSQTDALISGGIHYFNNPGFVFGMISNDKLSVKNAGHILIKHSGCILNDFEEGENEKVLIITGANMAGKSTFLRTIGCNLILAGAGFPVYAEKFQFKPQKIITGMRTSDSLAGSESYFFAELKRLKKISLGMKNGNNYYILLDEILKGTNSEDKHKGSEALIKKFISYKSLVFIATHDLKLGSLEDQFSGIIKNYHFDSQVEGRKLSFDYKLKEGIAKNMNASFLLRQMNILDD